MKSSKIHFTNKQGDKLAARLDFPVTGQPVAYALFAHCFTCNKNYKAIRNINTALTEAGFAVLRFDFTGLGESEGEFVDTNFSSNVEDLIAASGFLAKEHEAPQLLIGHSLGGAAALLAAKQLQAVKAVATIAAPSGPLFLQKQLQPVLDEIREKGELEVKLVGRPFKIKKQLLDDLESVNMEKHLSELDKALLVLHSPQDEIVNIDNAARIFKAVRHPKSFITLDGADHLLTNKEDSRYAGMMIAAWAKRYVGTLEEQDWGDESTVVVRTGENYYTEIRAGKHPLVADEPKDKGGFDLGPTPYEILAAALGACTGITLRMYANRKEWPLKAIEVQLSHKKVHAEDCEDCEKPSGQIDKLERIIELKGDLTEEQRERLLAIANKCPVHKTLSNCTIKVKTKLK